MKFMVRVRQDCSIGIPVFARNRLGISPGTNVTITTDAQNRIYLKPEKTVCPVCSASRKAVSLVTGMCSSCEQTVAYFVQEGDYLKTAITKTRKTNKK